MPEVKDSEGNVIANLPYTDEGMEQAKDMEEANQNLNVDYAPGGTSDGATRSVQQYAGGGLTGYSAIGAERPMYKEGGKAEQEDENSGEEVKKKRRPFKNLRDKLKNIKFTKTQTGVDAEGKKVTREVKVKAPKAVKDIADVGKKFTEEIKKSGFVGEVAVAKMIGKGAKKEYEKFKESKTGKKVAKHFSEEEQAKRKAKRKTKKIEKKKGKLHKRASKISKRADKVRKRKDKLHRKSDDLYWKAAEIWAKEEALGGDTTTIKEAKEKKK